MISVCMIMKNEEKFIDEMLKRLSKYDCEIVITDTGSTDNSIEIAKKYTDKVYYFEWIDDFSAARNFSVSKASNDAILVLDCDEYVEKADFSEIEDMIASSPDVFGYITLKSSFSLNGISQVSYARIPRAFSRRKYRYSGKVHEQLVRLDGKKPLGRDVPFEGMHYGYDENSVSLKEKSSRNIRLLKKELEESENPAYILYQIGKSYYAEKDFENAAHWFEKCAVLKPDINLEYINDMYTMYAYSLINTAKYDEAAGLLSLEDKLSGYADFPFASGLIYMNIGRLSDAVASFSKALGIKKFRVEGTNSYAANYNIGVIYECVGDTENALLFYEKCGSYAPALKGIERINANFPK